MKQYSFFVIIGSLLGLLLCSCKEDFDNNRTNNQVNTHNQLEFESVSNVFKSKNLTSADTFDFLPLPSSSNNHVVKHNYYAFSYNEKYEQAEWVAYELKANYIKNNNFKRPFFIQDAEVKTGSADWRNYKKTSFDKGHLCPAGDMKFDLKAYNDTFLTSNISPQDHNFNNGIWNRLEQKVRYWAVRYDGLYVVTGGVLNPNLETIGKEKIAVPKLFYKIVLNRSGKKWKMIGFLIPNKESSAPLYQFVVSVDTIEKVTGINFFPKLNDSIENNLEKTSDYKNWSF